jgi:hypothetical protein
VRSRARCHTSHCPRDKTRFPAKIVVQCYVTFLALDGTRRHATQRQCPCDAWRGRITCYKVACGPQLPQRNLLDPSATCRTRSCEACSGGLLYSGFCMVRACGHALIRTSQPPTRPLASDICQTNDVPIYLLVGRICLPCPSGRASLPAVLFIPAPWRGVWRVFHGFGRQLAAHILTLISLVPWC